MITNPVRLLDQADVPDSERALLDAGRAVRPVEYDVAAGEARFRRNLATFAAAGVVAGAAAGQGMRVSGKLLLGKLAVKVLLGVTLAAAFSGAGVVVGLRIAQERARTAAPVASAPVHARVAPAGAPVVAPAGAPVAAPAGAPVASAGAPANPVFSAPLAPATEPAALPSVGPEAVRRAAPHPAPEVAVHGARSHAGPAAAPAIGATKESFAIGTGAAAEPPAPEVLAAPQATAVPPTAPPAVTAPPVIASVPTAPPSTATAEAPSSMSEIRAVAMARSLVERDPAAALDLLAKAHHAYPTGYFLEEREALTVIALARAGRAAEARRAATSFLRAYPNGPYSDRVRAVTAP